MHQPKRKMGDTRGERYDANICSCCFANLTAECLSAGLLFCFFGGDVGSDAQSGQEFVL